MILKDPQSGKLEARPIAFGNEHDRSSRGWSDHFPVTVRLHVEP